MKIERKTIPKDKKEDIKKVKILYFNTSFDSSTRVKDLRTDDEKVASCSPFKNKEKVEKIVEKFIEKQNNKIK